MRSSVTFSRRLLKSAEHCLHCSGLNVRTGSPVDVRGLKVISSAQLTKSARQKKKIVRNPPDPAAAHQHVCFGLDDLQK